MARDLPGLNKPDWGPGRIDPFNPIKFGVLQMSIDETIGNSDMPPIWNMKARANHALHWDGLNTNFHEVVVSSAIGDGTTYESYPEKNMKKIEQWLQEVPTPKSPFSSELSSDSSFYLNTALAEQGKPFSINIVQAVMRLMEKRQEKLFRSLN